MKDYSKYFGKGWAEALTPFLSSDEYYKIGKEIKRQVDMGIEVTPGYSNMFRAFMECPWYTLNTIIIGQDVYPTKTVDGDFVADGIAFSAKNSKQPPPSLKALHYAIGDSMYDGDYTPPATWNYERCEATYDLQYLANQGILMLNCGLTTVVGRPGAHLKLWNPFIQYVVQCVTTQRDSLGIVLMGAHAKALRPIIKNNTHFVGMIEHPAKASYERRSWRHENVLKYLSKFHKTKNNIEIQW